MTAEMAFSFYQIRSEGVCGVQETEAREALGAALRWKVRCGALDAGRTPGTVTRLMEGQRTVMQPRPRSDVTVTHEYIV
ncbi:hypothetical protein E2C01_035376 [Portunus trituberculatus]|uniref:Uncharacterized protein n=1 Tax=Portunus trituberculatus TaxID=210409 RepID=A0A5B7F9L1_PORTR|nr:hypothetical protein [Portunus trituberculatus]